MKKLFFCLVFTFVGVFGYANTLEDKKPNVLEKIENDISVEQLAIKSNVVANDLCIWIYDLGDEVLVFWYEC